MLDHQLIIPRFIIKELHIQAETEEDYGKARRALEIVKKLELIPHLGIRYDDTDFSGNPEILGKLVRLARLLDANILSSDMSRIQMSKVEEITVVNIHALSNALKPLMISGELLKIEIQRYGREPRQGVGYLKDGTMVVVNGGGDHIGRAVEARVLSVKQTSSGRMVFCNLASENESRSFELDKTFADEKH